MMIARDAGNQQELELPWGRVHSLVAALIACSIPKLKAHLSLARLFEWGREGHDVRQLESHSAVIGGEFVLSSLCYSSERY